MSLSKLSQPLPELCLLATFSQLSLWDRISARKVCPEWHRLVGEVNRRISSLVIAFNVAHLKHIANQVNGLSIASELSVELLTANDGSPLYPVHRAPNCLHFSFKKLKSLPTAQQIISLFPEVTDLAFLGWNIDRGSSLDADIDQTTEQYLLEMLQNEVWRSRLTKLNVTGDFSTDNGTPKLFDAINALPALKYLTLSVNKIEELSIMSQLTELNFGPFSSGPIADVTPFIRSLQKYAATNSGGQITVDLSDGIALIPQLSELDFNKRSIISRISFFPISYRHTNLLSLCTNFSNLTSLSLRFYSSQCRTLFAALANLQQLFHLYMEICFADDDDAPVPPVFDPPKEKLLTVKALDLDLLVVSHLVDLQSLNLPLTMPNLQAIHLDQVDCRECDISSRERSKLDTIRFCIQTHLQYLHSSTGVPIDRLNYNSGIDFGSTKDLLAKK